MKDLITLNVLNPRGKIRVVKTSISTRLSSLDGKKIGILENDKTGALRIVTINTICFHNFLPLTKGLFYGGAETTDSVVV